MVMKQDQPQIRVNITFSPFNQVKISSGEFKAPDVPKQKEEQKLPEYDVPKTTKPSDFETRFDGDVLYSVPTISG